MSNKQVEFDIKNTTPFILVPQNEKLSINLSKYCPCDVTVWVCLFPHPWAWTGLITCSGQWNVAEVRMSQFWSWTQEALFGHTHTLGTLPDCPMKKPRLAHWRLRKHRQHTPDIPADQLAAGLCTSPDRSATSPSRPEEPLSGPTDSWAKRMLTGGLW